MRLSIDDTIAIVRNHVNKRGWTNTFNVWAGDGGWRSRAATAFRITGIPTTYIINGRGQIIHAGHPAGMDFGEEVDALLKSSPRKRAVNECAHLESILLSGFWYS